jgi:hypothetical protein
MNNKERDVLIIRRLLKNAVVYRNAERFFNSTGYQ